MTQPTPKSAAGEANQKDIDRIAAFSDAIFAFSMTVLAVSIGVPIITGSIADQLPEAMVKELPHFISFVVGFLVVAMYWTAHHRYFRYLRRIDGHLVWLNIFLLMFIAFMPVPTSYLGSYVGAPSIITFFAGTQIAVQLLELILWHHATQYQLVDPAVPPRLIQYYQMRAFLPMIVFTLSVLLAYTVGTFIAQMSWVLIWPVNLLMSRRYADIRPQIYGNTWSFFM